MLKILDWKSFNEGYNKTESVSFKSVLHEIFLDVSDVGSWYVQVDEYHTSKDGFSEPIECEVYISFGDTVAYVGREEEDDLGYDQKEINQDLIDCIKRSIDVMGEEGFSNQILYCTEHSHHPEEDYIEKLEIDDLEPGQWMSENDAIRIKFTK